MTELKTKDDIKEFMDSKPSWFKDLMSATRSDWNRIIALDDYNYVRQKEVN